MKAGPRFLFLGLTIILGTPLTATAASPAERLAERFAPITMLREQRNPPCDTAEEQYEPTSVDTVLGNPTWSCSAPGPAASCGTSSGRPAAPTSPASPTSTT